VLIEGAHAAMTGRLHHGSSTSYTFAEAALCILFCILRIFHPRLS